jgi:hypothetical protein
MDPDRDGESLRTQILRAVRESAASAGISLLITNDAPTEQSTTMPHLRLSLDSSGLIARRRML